MQKTLSAAMVADAQNGGSCATGVDQLEAAVSKSCETMLMDSATAFKEKLLHFLPDFEKWASSEPSLAFSKAEDLLEVTTHATFGRMKANILTSCSCQSGASSSNSVSCSLHSETVQLSDLIYEITNVVFQVFTDDYMCFSQLLRDQSLSGGAVTNTCLMSVSGLCLFSFF